MATTDGEPVFIDSNVLVFATARSSPLHARALSLIQGLHRSQTQLWISRQVIREYLVVMTRPQLGLGGMVFSRLLDDIRDFPTVFRIADETNDVTAKLLTLIAEHRVQGKQIHDANIVATMLARGVTHLLTDNVADFKRFSGTITVLPVRHAELND
jgi:predicted nucleic acid-binding protein